MNRNNYNTNEIIKPATPNQIAKGDRIKTLFDAKTGEEQKYAFIRTYSKGQKQKKGWNMIYKSKLQEAVSELSGKIMKIDIMFYTFRLFSKNISEVQIEQSKLAKKFKTSQPYISKVIKQMVDLGVILEVRQTIGRAKWYRLNPYIYIPENADGARLQEEWDLLTNAPIKVKDRFEYLYYLQSYEWRELAQRVKSEAGFKCSDCGSGENLEVHHLTYDRLFNEEIEDLICLCSVCHENRHRE